VIVVGAILGAITGTVAASVIAMGLISLPVMMRYGYDMKFATGVIAASGTITQLIPPSLVLIVLADQLGRSVGDMYAGAWGPSLIQVILFSQYVFGVSVFRPQWVPGIPPESRTITGWPLVKKCLWGIVPSVVPTFLLIGSTIFTLVFRGVDGDTWIEHLLSRLPGGAVGFLVFVNLFVFFLAFFLDFFEIAFIIVPLLAPVAAKLGIDLIWFGVLLCVNMQTSFMHPPFGFALFYLRGIAPKEVKSSQIYWGAIPWVVLQL